MSYMERTFTHQSIVPKCCLLAATAATTALSAAFAIGAACSAPEAFAQGGADAASTLLDISALSAFIGLFAGDISYGVAKEIKGICENNARVPAYQAAMAP